MIQSELASFDFVALRFPSAIAVFATARFGLMAQLESGRTEERRNSMPRATIAWSCRPTLLRLMTINAVIEVDDIKLSSGACNLSNVKRLFLRTLRRIRREIGFLGGS